MRVRCLTLQRRWRDRACREPGSSLTMTTVAANPDLCCAIDPLYFISSRARFPASPVRSPQLRSGWQVYEMTSSASVLGMIGLVQFLPTAVLVFVAGNAVDRFDRKRVLQFSQIAEGLTAVFLAWGTYAGWLTVPEIFLAMLVVGTRRRISKVRRRDRAAASRGADWHPATRDRDLERLRRTCDHRRPCARRLCVRDRARSALRHHGRLLADWRPRDRHGRRSNIVPPMRPRPTPTISMPVSNSSGRTRRSSAPSRSICSRCCLAARPRCCRSMRATSCIRGRGDSKSCAPHRRSVRS